MYATVQKSAVPMPVNPLFAKNKTKYHFFFGRKFFHPCPLNSVIFPKFLALNAKGEAAGPYGKIKQGYSHLPRTAC